MKYSKLYKSFIAEVKIKARDEFKFIVEGIYKLSDLYETTFVFPYLFIYQSRILQEMKIIYLLSILTTKKMP